MNKYNNEQMNKYPRIIPVWEQYCYHCLCKYKCKQHA